jgi:hypothetical protein
MKTLSKATIAVLLLACGALPQTQQEENRESLIFKLGYLEGFSVATLTLVSEDKRPTILAANCHVMKEDDDVLANLNAIRPSQAIKEPTALAGAVNEIRNECRRKNLYR